MIAIVTEAFSPVILFFITACTVSDPYHALLHRLGLKLFEISSEKCVELDSLAGQGVQGRASLLAFAFIYGVSEGGPAIVV